MTVAQRRSVTSFLYSVPIGILGGLIGLGGAEFRLPVLTGRLNFDAKSAVSLNLAVSLITVSASLVARGQMLSFASVSPLGVEILSLTSAAICAAFFGTALVGYMTTQRLHRVMVFLLVTIGVMLIAEGFLPQQIPALVPTDAAWRILVGLLLGSIIGLVSSLLGVAGGELIIPTLVFAFGADIKTAGTASLLISFPTVLVGILRHWHRGAYRSRADLNEVVAPMGIGSIIGAFIGGQLAGAVPASALKVGLGVILNWSAMKMAKASRHEKSSDTVTA